VKFLCVLAIRWYVAYITYFSSTEITCGNDSATFENGLHVHIDQAEYEKMIHLFVSAELQHIAQLGMARIQNFEKLVLLLQACSRYSKASGKYKGLNCRWNLKWPRQRWCCSRSSSIYDVWLKFWAPTQCSNSVVWPLIYFAAERKGFMIKAGFNLFDASRKHSLQQLSCFGDSDSITINGTQFFVAYLGWSSDLGGPEMSRFLATSDATILFQEFLQLNISLASSLSKTRELENTQLTVRQWDPGTVKLISMGVLSWIVKLLGLSQCASLCAGRSFELLFLHLIITPLCAMKIFLSQLIKRFSEDKQMHMIGSSSVMTATSVRDTASMDCFEISGEDSVPILNQEQIAHVLVVLPKFLLPLQRPQGLELLTIFELKDVYKIAIMPVVPCVEDLDAHLQWDPGGFMLDLTGEQEQNRTEQLWRMQTIGTHGNRLTIALDDLSAPWDPGNSLHPASLGQGQATYMLKSLCCDLSTPLLGDKQCFVGMVV
jgi:hypothetical protein